MEAMWLNAPEPTAITAEDLRAQGIGCERLSLEAAHPQPVLHAFQKRGRYISQDAVSLTPATKNLFAMCADFANEHRHDEDKVRFILEGEGIFDIRSKDDRWMRVHVTPWVSS